MRVTDRRGNAGARPAAAIVQPSALLPVWASALVIAVLPAAVAAAMAAAGKKQIAQAGTPARQETIDSVKADVAEIKEAAHR